MEPRINADENVNNQIQSQTWSEPLLRDAPDASLARKICEALHSLLRADIELLIRDVNEKTITGRLADYLQLQFPEWNVDCEYNRDGHDVKKIDGRIVVPDIVVHQRGGTDNLLVIEVKKSNSKEPDVEDLEKLKQFKTSRLGYRNALFIKFSIGHRAPGVQRTHWV